MAQSQIVNPRIVSRAEWLVARKDLLTKEKEFTRSGTRLSGHLKSGHTWTSKIRPMGRWLSDEDLRLPASVLVRWNRLGILARKR